ncbi:MAG: hypothetical protein VB022_01525 [Rikenellaceae bacterium]|nr:hypothetical protein [Rikenellaceae bacterium]
MNYRLPFTALTLFLTQLTFSQTRNKEVSFSIDATLKTRYEWATETSTSRFSVRNSRLGLSGKVTSQLSYRAQLELSSDGKFEVLDLYGNFSLPSGFIFSLGQTSIPLFNASQITPSQMVFANRSFVGKFNTGSRDIGLLTTFNRDMAGVPVKMQFGIFNGTTINNPRWTGRFSFNGRVMLGGDIGWRASAKFTRFPLSAEKDYMIYGADVRFASTLLKVEAEAMNRHNYYNDINRFTAYVETSIKFPINGDMIVKAIIPAIRWDGIGESLCNKGLDANRLTAGFSFALTEAPFNSLLRLDVEKYFIKREISDFSLYEELDSDKITLELLIVF